MEQKMKTKIEIVMAEKKESKTMTVRGTARIDRETGDVNFRAAQSGEPVQRNVKKYGKSSFYETEGEKQSSYVCHLKVDKDAVDPVADMRDQLEHLTANLRKKEPAAPRGKFLLDKPGLVVIHNRKAGEVSVRLTIDLRSEGMLSFKLFNLVSEVNKCFAINQKELTPTT